MITQYSYMLTLIESNPSFLLDLIDLLARVECLVLNFPLNSSSSIASTHEIDFGLLDELRVVLDHLFFELNVISTWLSYLESDFSKFLV